MYFAFISIVSIYVSNVTSSDSTSKVFVIIVKSHVYWGLRHALAPNRLISQVSGPQFVE